MELTICLKFWFLGERQHMRGEQSQGFANVWDPLYVTFQTLLPLSPNASITLKQLPKKLAKSAKNKTTNLLLTQNSKPEQFSNHFCASGVDAVTQILST